MQHSELEYLKTFVMNVVHNNMDGAIPAIVRDVSKLETEQVISASPAIGELDPDSNTVLEPVVIYDIPVVYMGTQESLISVPIKEGDFVYLVPCERDTGAWIDSIGDNIIPDIPAKFKINSCFAFTGIGTAFNNQKPSKDNVEIKFKDIKFSLKPDGTFTFENNNLFIEHNEVGSITITLPASSVTLSDDGSSTITNNSGGSIDMASSGIVTINNVTFDLAGNVTTPTTVVAGTTITAGTSVAAPTVAAATSLTVAGKEQSLHTHPYTDDGTNRTTGPPN